MRYERYSTRSIVLHIDSSEIAPGYDLLLIIEIAEKPENSNQECVNFILWCSVLSHDIRFMLNSGTINADATDEKIVNDFLVAFQREPGFKESIRDVISVVEEQFSDEHQDLRMAPPTPLQ